MSTAFVTRTIRRAGISCGIALSFALPVGLAHSAPAPAPVPPPAQSAQAASSLTARTDLAVAPGAAEALAKSKGISVAAATARLAGQRSLGDLGLRVEASLKGRTGGSYLDADSRLVVTTVDAAGDSAAARSGAKAKRVRFTGSSLSAIVKRLDQEARTRGAGSVQGWFVDVPRNVVVVTSTAGATDQAGAHLLDLARSYGSKVSVEPGSADQAPRPTEWMVGGYGFLTATGGSCSVGFNTRDGANRNVVLTAGHCTKVAGNATRNGYLIGAMRTSDFPGSDHGTFWNSYPTYWQPSPSVYLWNNTYLTVRGTWNPPVGATICKSGITTGWTCGTVTAKDRTVTYPEGVITGLVQHNACVEPGDSGGSNISTNGYAVGVTSGASLIDKRWCRSRYGQPNISWYQPIAPALSANGLRLLVG